MEEKKLLLTAREAEKIFSISRWSLYKMALRGDLPSIKIGGLRRFSKKALSKALLGQFYSEEKDGEKGRDGG